MGEAADGRTWRPNGRHFTLQISLLIDAFLEVTNADVMEADVVCCWSELPKPIPLQRDESAFAHVISYLDNLAQCLPTRKAWDELVCLPPSTVPCTPCWTGHLGYIQGQVVELGPLLPSTWLCISQPGGQFICVALGLLFEGSMLAYNPVSNEVEWIPVQGMVSDLSQVGKTSARELSNMVPHDSDKGVRRLDWVGEQRSESGAEK